jgi:hypothetical protein
VIDRSQPQMSGPEALLRARAGKVDADDQPQSSPLSAGIDTGFSLVPIRVLMRWLGGGQTAPTPTVLAQPVATPTVAVTVAAPQPARQPEPTPAAAKARDWKVSHTYTLPVRRGPLKRPNFSVSETASGEEYRLETSVPTRVRPMDNKPAPELNLLPPSLPVQPPEPEPEPVLAPKHQPAPPPAYVPPPRPAPASHVAAPYQPSNPALPPPVLLPDDILPDAMAIDDSDHDPWGVPLETPEANTRYGVPEKTRADSWLKRHAQADDPVQSAPPPPRHRPRRTQPRTGRITLMLVAVIAVATAITATIRHLRKPDAIVSSSTLGGVVTGASLTVATPTAGVIGPLPLQVGDKVETNTELFRITTAPGEPPRVITASQPVRIAFYRAKPGDFLSAMSPVVELVDCARLSVTADAAEAAAAGFAANRPLTIRLAGGPSSAMVRMPASPSRNGPLLLPIDAASLQALGGDTCPVGRSVTLQAK